MPKLLQYDGKNWVEIAKNGQDGIDGVGKMGPQGPIGPSGSPDTPKDIKDKLESLKGKKRLNISAIEGVEKLQKEMNHISAFGSSGQEYRVAGAKVSANSHTLNFIAGSNTTITGAPTSDGMDVTITASGGGSVFVNGVEVTDPDFVDSTEISITPTGSSVSLTTIGASGSFITSTHTITVVNGLITAITECSGFSSGFSSGFGS